MTLTTKTYAALALALVLWAVETWLLVDAAGYTFTPQVAVIPAATAGLAFLPLVLKDAGWGLRVAILASCGFLAAFVFQGVLERTANPLDTRIALAANSTEARRLLESELTRERGRLSNAEDEAKRESRRGGCRETCKVWRAAATGHQARIDTLLHELADERPALVADPVAKRVSDMSYGVISAETVSNWKPAFQPFGFLIGIWSLLGFGLRDMAPATVSSPKTAAGGGGNGFRLVNREDADVAAVRRVLNSRGTVSNDELATLLNVTKGEASKRVARCLELGAVSRVRAGRHVAISLNHAH